LELNSDAGNALSAFASAGGKAVYAQSTGGGIAIHGYNLGTSGEAAFFRTESGLNGSAAVTVQNNGTGAGIQATAKVGSAGLLQVVDASSNARALDATTAGLGDAARTTITNEVNWSNALWARTFGLGRAALFEISNVNSTATVLEAKTNGSGLAGKFVGDVELLGNVEVDGTLYATYGSSMNRATPIAYGRLGNNVNPSGSDNLVFETLASTNDYTTWRVTVQGEAAPSSWIVLATVAYSDPENATRTYEVRTGRPDSQGRFKIHLHCTNNCNIFSAQSYGVSFAVYRP
jgi:hypothetical protein